MSDEEKFTYETEVHGPATLQTRVYRVRSEKDTVSIVRDCKSEFADEYGFRYGDLKGHSLFHDEDEELAYVSVTPLPWGDEDE